MRKCVFMPVTQKNYSRLLSTLSPSSPFSVTFLSPQVCRLASQNLPRFFTISRSYRKPLSGLLMLSFADNDTFTSTSLGPAIPPTLTARGSLPLACRRNRETSDSSGCVGGQGLVVVKRFQETFFPVSRRQHYPATPGTFFLHGDNRSSDEPNFRFP